MCSSYKSVSEILSETKSLESSLLHSENYWAHTSKIDGMRPETLAKHVELVLSYFEISCKLNGLDKVLDHLIRDFVRENNIDDLSKEIGDFVKKLFVNVIAFHDHGKVNENFQAHKYKMNNPLFKYDDHSPLGTYHSALGAYLFIVKHSQDLSKSFIPAVQKKITGVILALSYNIFKHHSGCLNDHIHETITLKETDIEKMKNYITRYQFDIKETFSKTLPKQTGHLLKNHIIPSLKAPFPLFALVKLNFSLLTSSDYLATSEYATGMVFNTAQDFGLITAELRQRLIKNIENTQPYNKITYQKYSDHYQFSNPTSLGNDNLNILRQEMAIKLINNLRQAPYKKLFYIEAPTGGGKTNLAMIATVEFLKSNNDLNKVFYVFPFTTLITQTYKSVIETLGLRHDEITQLHSKASIQTKEELKDGEYGDEKKNYIDNLFVNYPFCLLSHIKFFDILKTNEKEANYLLHRLSNSVVVLDELQSYNPEHWDKLIYFINNYADYFNIKFILMSATLPKLGNLQVFKDFKPDFVYLLGDDSRNNYFVNPNFKDRVSFNFSLIESNDFNEKPYGDKLDHLTSYVFEKSKLYASTVSTAEKPKDSVFIIIEFIFKKSATAFFERINNIQEENLFFDEVFVLSGTILEHRRKQIINFLKNKSNRNKRILLITTQVVEAGVDIDMDLGFKDVSLIDSDEQLAGRINRNVNKPQGELFLFKLDEAKKIYGTDLRFKFTRDQINTDLYKEVLSTKNFDRLYKEVFAKIDKLNDSKMTQNFSTYVAEIKSLNFTTIAEDFKLIDQNNISIFLPIDIPIKVEGTVDNKPDDVFSINDLKFLRALGVETASGYISGKDVFDIYTGSIMNRNPDFIMRKIELKTLQAIVSKFVFPVFKTKDIENLFIRFSDIEKNRFGYIYLQHWADVYDVNYGIKEQAFNKSNFI